MRDETAGAPEPDHPRVHWDWHVASNGAGPAQQDAREAVPPGSPNGLDDKDQAPDVPDELAVGSV